jgi:hypothetical protein
MNFETLINCVFESISLPYITNLNAKNIILHLILLGNIYGGYKTYIYIYVEVVAYVKIQCEKVVG